VYGVETWVIWLALHCDSPGEAMEQAAIRALIYAKLRNGTLPVNGFPRFWIGPSDGEECHGCDRIITDNLVVEGIASAVGGRQAIQMHIACFAIWDEQRRDGRL
jgi:hypothetical protein